MTRSEDEGALRRTHCSHTFGRFKRKARSWAAIPLPTEIGGLQSVGLPGRIQTNFHPPTYPKATPKTSKSRGPESGCVLSASSSLASSGETHRTSLVSLPKSPVSSTGRIRK